MPRLCNKNITAAKKAAEVISTISIRKVAWQYGVSDMSIRRYLWTLRAGHSLWASPPAALGRPRALTVAEDAALAAFVIWLAEAGFPALPIQVKETANYLRNLREL
ncbi:hypothetical protein CI238_10299 [Colletotrichum incanum]|uniref:Uncharacterized protein n=1 Tax=Colletotrichum incanum TaxID=1573173 RepID=A0A162PIV6_COLIC|nr:hypothetical protein CI238_10299 [Colletotrichum incanum]